MSNKERLDTAKGELVEFAKPIIEAMQSPVLRAVHAETDDSCDYDNPADIAEIICDEFKHLVTCGEPIEVVKVRVARAIASGYNWLNNGVEFYLRERA